MHKITPETELVVVGDIHAHLSQVKDLIKEASPSSKRILVSVGDILDKGFPETEKQDEIEICNIFMELEKQDAFLMVKGNHELKRLRRIKKESREPWLAWLGRHPLCNQFVFESGATVTVIHAGITPLATSEDLYRSTEVCYVRDVDPETGKMIPLIWKEINNVKTLIKEKPGINWHELYPGKFGYIFSGHAANRDTGRAKYFKYSCNLDSSIYSSGNLTARFVDGQGNLGKELIISGPFSNPDINVAY